MENPCDKCFSKTICAAGDYQCAKWRDWYSATWDEMRDHFAKQVHCQEIVNKEVTDCGTTEMPKQPRKSGSGM